MINTKSIIYYKNLKPTPLELQEQLIKENTQNEVDLDKLQQLLRSDYKLDSEGKVWLNGTNLFSEKRIKFIVDSFLGISFNNSLWSTIKFKNEAQVAVSGPVYIAKYYLPYHSYSSSESVTATVLENTTVESDSIKGYFITWDATAYPGIIKDATIKVDLKLNDSQQLIKINNLNATLALNEEENPSAILISWTATSSLGTSIQSLNVQSLSVSFEIEGGFMLSLCDIGFGMYQSELYQEYSETPLEGLSWWIDKTVAPNHQTYTQLNQEQCKVSLRDYRVQGNSITGFSNKQDESLAGRATYTSDKQKYISGYKVGNIEQRYFWGFTDKYVVPICNNFQTNNFTSDFFTTVYNNIEIGASFKAMAVNVKDDTTSVDAGIKDSSGNNKILTYKLEEFPFLTIALEYPGVIYPKDNTINMLGTSPDSISKLSQNRVYAWSSGSNNEHTAGVIIRPSQDAVWEIPLIYEHTKIVYYVIPLENNMRFSFSNEGISIKDISYSWEDFVSAFSQYKKEANEVIEKFCLQDFSFQVSLPTIKDNSLGHGAYANGNGSSHTNGDYGCFAMVSDNNLIASTMIDGWKGTLSGVKYKIKSILPQTDKITSLQYSVDPKKCYQHTYTYAASNRHGLFGSTTFDLVKFNNTNEYIVDNDDIDQTFESGEDFNETWSSCALAESVCLVTETASNHLPLPNFISTVDRFYDTSIVNGSFFCKNIRIKKDGEVVSEISDDVFKDIPNASENIDHNSIACVYNRSGNSLNACFIGVRMGYALPKQQPSIAVFLTNYEE